MIDPVSGSTLPTGKPEVPDWLRDLNTYIGGIFFEASMMPAASLSLSLPQAKNLADSVQNLELRSALNEILYNAGTQYLAQPSVNAIVVRYLNSSDYLGKDQELTSALKSNDMHLATSKTGTESSLAAMARQSLKQSASYLEQLGIRSEMGLVQYLNSGE